MTTDMNCTAFAGQRLLAQGRRAEVALAVKEALAAGEQVLAFDDGTGRQIDFDLRGDADAIVARLTAEEAGGESAGPRGAGRPRLGVVAREVTLLPRHWDWLAAQPGGASVTLRKLVETARKAESAAPTRRQAQEAADRFMAAMLGNAPGYEEAARALYAADGQRFRSLSEPWPADLRDHARRLAAPALAGPDSL